MFLVVSWLSLAWNPEVKSLVSAGLSRTLYQEVSLFARSPFGVRAFFVKDFSVLPVPLLRFGHFLSKIFQNTAKFSVCYRGSTLDPVQIERP